MDGDQVLTKGLILCGFECARHGAPNTKLRRFRAHFGVGPDAVAAIYNDLIPVGVHINDLLMGLNFLKGYDTEHVLSGRWKMDEKKLREKNRATVKAIQALKEKKVVWGEWDDDEVFIVSVDGVHCKIREVRKDPSSKWFDHKSHGAGLTYELAIAIRSGKLVWMKGPFPASVHDIKMFRGEEGDPNNKPEESLKAMIPDDMKGIGDSGYKGEPQKMSTTKPRDSKEVKKFKGQVKSRHETFNGRIKFFLVLDMPFRHDISQHKQCFEACCIAVQYDLENGHPLFEIR
ncbi:MAG: hypothetical protein SGARI_002359 [Bacillariaceae sp.]